MEKLVHDYFGSLYDEKGVLRNDTSQPLSPMFTEDEVEAGIQACNFRKGIGSDLFDGSVLKNENIR